MGIIRRAELSAREAAGVRLDLGDLSRRGEQVRQVAEEEARKIIAEARAERERIMAGAREAGYAEGLRAGETEGLARGEARGKDEAATRWGEKIAGLEAVLNGAIEQFERARELALFEARQDLLTLALVIAQRIVKREIQANPGVVADQLAAAIGSVARPSALAIAVNPDDQEVAAAVIPGLVKRLGASQHAELMVDPSLPRGSCVVRSVGGGAIDASVSTQIQRMVEALAPAGVRGDPARAEAAAYSPEVREPADSASPRSDRSDPRGKAAA